MIPVYRSDKTIGLTRARALPSILLSREWNGHQSTRSLNCIVAADPGFLYLGACSEHAPCFDRSVPPGEFHEGLWEQDAFEIFISDGSRYQEFNLSPSGAWWSSVFDSPRSKAPEVVQGVQIETASEVQESRWCAIAAIPREALHISATFDNDTRANICACLGEKTRTYLSAVALPGERADFHQPDRFAPVLSLPLW